MAKTFRFKRIARPVKVNLPSRPVLQNSVEQEQLLGEVRGVKASAPEERLAKAYDEGNIQYLFRYVVGAPKGLPGWKEVDFVVLYKGMVYVQELDTAFTHREKAFKDVLHDSIVLNDFELNTVGTLFPEVQHIDGDFELSSMEQARQFVKRTFGRSSGSTIGWLPQEGIPQIAPQRTIEPSAPVQITVQRRSESDERSAARHRAAFQQRQRDNEIRRILNARRNR